MRTSPMKEQKSKDCFDHAYRNIVSLCRGLRLVYALSLMGLIMPRCHAQFVPYSQYDNTPLLTNPANTGFTDGPYRVAANLRKQGTGAGFFTGYLSAEVSPLCDKLPMGHRAGLGLYLMMTRPSVPL